MKKKEFLSGDFAFSIELIEAFHLLESRGQVMKFES